MLWERQINKTVNPCSRNLHFKRALTLICSQNIRKNEMYPIRDTNKFIRRERSFTNGKFKERLIVIISPNLPGTIPVYAF